MARTPSFERFTRLLRAALVPKERSSSALNTISQLADAATRPSSQPISRRSFLRHSGVVGAVAATTLLGGRTSPSPSHGASSSRPWVSVGIVGAGLAGLACADVLKQRGIYATVYEAAPRAGGRCWSLRSSAERRQLYLLSAGTIYDFRRPGRTARRKSPIRRRAHELIQ